LEELLAAPQADLLGGDGTAPPAHTAQTAAGARQEALHVAALRQTLDDELRGNLLI